ncbi:MAG: peptide ABC transporter permease [Rhizobiales bacterium PAR1]|nr:MAG: peptide ABC transporter permease [Rhizobiales bacterium PAR1]
MRALAPLLKAARTLRGGPAALVLLALVFCAIFAPLLAPFPYDAMHLPSANMEPDAKHWMGTDEFGRDLFSRILYGARISLGVAVSSMAASVLIGVIIGGLAGYFGGWVDRTLMAISDMTWSFPEILIALVLIAIIGPGLGSTAVAITVGYFAQFARLTRAQIIALKGETYIEAARNLGASDAAILFRHLIPNAMTPVLVAGMLATGDAIILEATLGFFGLGAQPPLPSWGAIMSSGTAQIFIAPWVILYPGLVIAVAVVSINLFGDALIDALDIRGKLREG